MRRIFPLCSGGAFYYIYTYESALRRLWGGGYGRIGGNYDEKRFSGAVILSPYGRYLFPAWIIDSAMRNPHNDGKQRGKGGQYEPDDDIQMDLPAVRQDGACHAPGRFRRGDESPGRAGHQRRDVFQSALLRLRRGGGFSPEYALRGPGPGLSRGAPAGPVAASAACAGGDVEGAPGGARRGGPGG